MADRNSEEKNLRNSIYSIDVSKGPRSLPMRKGTACAVKQEGSSSAILLTSQKVVEHGSTLTGNLSLSSKQFCPEYPAHEAEDKHRIKEALQPRNKEQFCFIPLQTSPKYSLKLVSASKLRGEAGEGLLKSKCLSYTFIGNSFKTLTWEYNEDEGNHELTDVDPKGDLVRSACRGSPIVSTQDDDRSVIGVVDCTSDGELSLMFFKESSLDIEELRAGCADEGRDVTDSPISPPQPTPSAPPPEEKPLNAERNHYSQEPGATHDNARDVENLQLADTGSPEENDNKESGVTVLPSATILSRTLSNIAIQEEDSQSPEKKLSKESKSEDIKCLWNQELQSREYFQHLLTSILKINLDPKRELGGDYRSLAGAMGKNMKYIWYLANKQSPVEELIRNHIPPLTLGLLVKLLSSKEVGRDDVAKEIRAWVEKQCCNCSECGGML